MMEVRKTRKEDIADVMEIINQAKKYMDEHDQHQWTKEYPSSADIEEDIANGCAYVLEKDGKVTATAAIIAADEPDYAKIDGAWLNDEPYVVIHRIAVHNEAKGTGVGSRMILAAKEIALHNGMHNLRIDTTDKNVNMQKLIMKNGFVFCGIITLTKDGGLRNAYQKMF